MKVLVVEDNRETSSAACPGKSVMTVGSANNPAIQS
jgi:hypothetical protein